MELTEFTIKTPSGIEVNREYEGNPEGGVTVFSHGFGVTRDSYGMFNEIGDHLKDKFLVVRFDYVLINKAEYATTILPFNQQVEMLDSVIEHIKGEFEPDFIDVISHSMGCVITAMRGGHDLHNVTLLAGPPQAPYERLKAYFSKRPETVINEKGTSKVKRSNGSWTFIDSGLWQDMKEVEPEALYSKLAEEVDTVYVRATEDQIVKDVDYTKLQSDKYLQYTEFKANHDFRGEARSVLIDYLVARHN